MKIKLFLLITLFFQILAGTKTSAHPGSGIVVDKYGQIYFTDTGKGIWKLNKQGKLMGMPGSAFHWMGIDPNGYFAESQPSFGNFERVTPKSSKPTLMICSDFPFVVSPDGNIYYADTRNSLVKIRRRTPNGKESVLATDKTIKLVSGMTSGADGTLYLTEVSSAKVNRILKVTKSGKVSVLANFPFYCRGLTVDAAGTVYIAATGSRRIVKITSQGVITTVLKSGGLWRPTGVTAFNGKLYVLEWQDVPRSLEEVRDAWIPRIRKIGSDGAVITLATVTR